MTFDIKAARGMAAAWAPEPDEPIINELLMAQMLTAAIDEIERLRKALGEACYLAEAYGERNPIIDRQITELRKIAAGEE
jgi:hypothetical protein